MIEVDITLNRYGSGDRQQLAFIKIINDATGDAEIGNYDVIITDADGTRTSRVEDHKRFKPVIDLLASALRQAGH